MSDVGYDFSTISVAAGSTTVTGDNTAFATWVKKGYPLFAAGEIVPVVDVVDDETLTIGVPWPGATLVDEPYIVLYLSTAQLEFADYRRQVAKMLATLEGATIMVHVPADEDEPDGSLGEEGWFAVKVAGDDAGSAWKFWVKEGGVWVSKGAPVGVAWTGVWNSATAYGVNDVISRLGVVYIALQASTNQPPESSPSYWQVLIQAGGRYDLMWSDSDKPASGETVIKVVFNSTVTFPAGMAQSLAVADVPATATAVFSLRKNGVEFATYTFAPGQDEATFVCPVATTFGPGDLYTEVAPAPRDSTLSGVSSTKTGYRS